LIHHDWDNSHQPVLRIKSGDLVHFELLMAGHGQVREDSSIEDVVWDFDTIYNLAGPIFVEGAAPGDTLEVEILSLTPGPWGWTAACSRAATRTALRVTARSASPRSSAT